MSNDTIFELLHTIEHVTHKMLVRMKQDTDYDLGISHILVLHELRMNGECRPSDLAKILNFTPASLTHLSSKLATHKLITKKQDDTDKRVSYWKITKEGIDVLNEAQKNGQVARKELFSHLTEDEQNALLTIYKKLDISLQAENV